MGVGAIASLLACATVGFAAGMRQRRRGPGTEVLATGVGLLAAAAAQQLLALVTGDPEQGSLGVFLALPGLVLVVAVLLSVAWYRAAGRGRPAGPALAVVALYVPLAAAGLWRFGPELMGV